MNTREYEFFGHLVRGATGSQYLPHTSDSLCVRGRGVQYWKGGPLSGLLRKGKRVITSLPGHSVGLGGPTTTVDESTPRPTLTSKKMSSSGVGGRCLVLTDPGQSFVQCVVLHS